MNYRDTTDRDKSSLMIITDAHEQLRKSALDDVGCHMEGEYVILCGEVRSYYRKQLAQERIRRFITPFSIVNDITVASHSRRPDRVGFSGP